MNAVRAIDTVANTLVAEAGCILGNLRRAAQDAGRLLPLSPVSYTHLDVYKRQPAARAQDGDAQAGRSGLVHGAPRSALLAGGAGGQDDARVAAIAVGAALLLLQFRQALFVQGLEVDFGQVQRRHRGAGDRCV